VCVSPRSPRGLVGQRGAAKLAKELLPAIDNLDRALDAAATDQAGPRRPRGEIEKAGQLGDPRPLVRLAVLVDRRLPVR